ncbi:MULTISPECIES: AraC family transcriptional regulator [Ruminococcus]|uniref:helix-turn-helix domain-containing protein n=1 Tax=Ruminococcus TaxID=1263 RepID=UPI00048F1A17|nr:MULTISPECIES: AraC family transcriptional regulator [Ruminococcus]MCR5022198.1 AraC family transcriptional regulator [Ruminococcus sp.]
MFYINRMGCSCRHDGNFVLDQPRGYEGHLMLFVKTKAVFVINGVTINVEPNTFIIYDKNSPQYYKACDDEYINDWIQFECSEDISSGVDIKFDMPIYIGESIDVASYFRLIADCYYRRNNLQTAGFLIKALLTEVFSENGKQEESGIVHYRELLDLRRRIYAQPSEDWSVEKMAQLISVSEPYLHLLYKKAFGITCNADVINSRIESAKHFLAYTDRTVEDIAFTCGYKNAVHFSRQFKQATTLSPSEWRKNNSVV